LYCIIILLYYYNYNYLLLLYYYDYNYLIMLYYIIILCSKEVFFRGIKNLKF
jgi:hypothetical protein